MPSFQKPPTVSDDYRAVHIYRRAATVISEKGFSATSMGDIADAVDLTKGGLYYYIKGKKALLFAIMNFAMDILEREVLAPARDQVDPHRRLAEMVSGHLRVVLNDPSAMSILVFEEDNLAAEHQAKIKARRRAYLRLLQESIAAVLGTEGNGRDIDPELAAESVIGTIHWVVRWQASKQLSQEQVIQQVSYLLLHGLVSYPVTTEPFLP